MIVIKGFTFFGPAVVEKNIQEEKAYAFSSCIFFFFILMATENMTSGLSNYVNLDNFKITTHQLFAFFIILIATEGNDFSLIE